MPHYPTVAEYAFTETRAFYTGGLKRSAWAGHTEGKTPPGPGKSPNKMLLNAENKHRTDVIGIHDYEGRDPTFELRRAVATEGYMNTMGAESPEGIPIEYGRKLVAQKVAGLNCGELAAIAAFKAWEKCGNLTPVKDIAVASLAEPANHGWCMVGPPLALAALAGKTIAELKGKTHDTGAAYVVDPWTNLCCPIGDFHDAVRAKAKRWMERGKRISWTGKDDNKKGWYPPLGDYIDCFVTAAIKLQYALDKET